MTRRTIVSPAGLAALVLLSMLPNAIAAPEWEIQRWIESPSERAVIAPGANASLNFTIVTQTRGDPCVSPGVGPAFVESQRYTLRVDAPWLTVKGGYGNPGGYVGFSVGCGLRHWNDTALLSVANDTPVGSVGTLRIVSNTTATCGPLCTLQNETTTFNVTILVAARPASAELAAAVPTTEPAPSHAPATPGEPTQGPPPAAREGDERASPEGQGVTKIAARQETPAGGVVAGLGAAGLVAMLRRTRREG